MFSVTIDSLQCWRTRVNIHALTKLGNSSQLDFLAGGLLVLIEDDMVYALISPGSKEILKAQHGCIDCIAAMICAEVGTIGIVHPSPSSPSPGSQKPKRLIEEIPEEQWETRPPRGVCSVQVPTNLCSTCSLRLLLDCMFRSYYVPCSDVVWPQSWKCFHWAVHWGNRRPSKRPLQAVESSLSCDWLLKRPSWTFVFSFSGFSTRWWRYGGPSESLLSVCG